MKVEIYIATHKSIDYPKNLIYIPIHVGCELSDLNLEYISDNSLDNISELNKSFCELTALYWMWKNSSADILGLMHYRRYLIGNKSSYLFNGKRIIDDKEVEETLLNNDIIVAKSYFLRHLKFIPLTVKKHYYKNHYMKDWLILKGVINEYYPEYMVAFNCVENKISMHCCNIFIARKVLLNKYCTWLFDILFKVQKIINIDEYDVYQKRIFGFMAERLLNVYIEHHKLKIKTQRVLIIK